jgi:hypothetical protein
MTPLVRVRLELIFTRDPVLLAIPILGLVLSIKGQCPTASVALAVG